MAQDNGNQINQQNQPQQVTPLELAKTQEDCQKYAYIVRQFYPSAEVVEIPDLEVHRSLVLKVKLEDVGVNHFLVIHPLISEKRGDMLEYHTNLNHITSTYSVERSALTVLMPGGSGDLNIVNSYDPERPLIPITHAIVPSNKARVIRTFVRSANLFRYEGVKIIDIDSHKVDPSSLLANEAWRDAFSKVNENIIKYYTTEK